MKITKQKHGQPWKNEAGDIIPWELITPVERVNEKITVEIAAKALKASEGMKELKAFIDKQIDVARAAFHKHYSGKRLQFKGNYTFFNYSHTVKVERSVSNPVQFDDMLISNAQELLKQFLESGVSAKNAAIKTLVMSAFETTRKKLDVKKILQLKKFTAEINDPIYTRAMKLIDRAIKRPETATYYKVYIKNEKGEWMHIPLALADV